MTESEKKVRVWKQLIAHFRQNKDSYSHGEFEEIEGICKYISECVFAPEENAANIKSVREKVFKWKLTWKKEDEERFTEFFRICNQIIKDEALLNAFQAELTNIKPIDDATIRQFYEEITNSFDADKFNLCKRILKGIQQKNQPLVWEYYFNTEGELVAKAGLKNRGVAKKILVRFCSEINLDYRPCTKEELEKWKEQKAGYVLQLEETINNLKNFQEETGEKLDKFKVEIDTFLSDNIQKSADYKEKNIKDFAGNTKPYYQENDRINKLQTNKDELQKVKQRAEKLRKSVLDLKKFIAGKLKEVEVLVGGNGLSNITDDNVITMLGKVMKEYEAVRKKYIDDNNAGIDEYNSQIKRFNALLEQFNKLTDEITNERKKADGNREDIIRRLKSDLQKQKKSITGGFIGFQICLLIGTFIGFGILSGQHFSMNSNIKMALTVILCVNALLLIRYVFRVSRQFNKHNEAAFELNNYGQRTSCYMKTKIISNIILSCIFFVLPQTFIFVMYNFLFNP